MYEGAPRRVGAILISKMPSHGSAERDCRLLSGVQGSPLPIVLTYLFLLCLKLSLLLCFIDLVPVASHCWRLPSITCSIRLVVLSFLIDLGCCEFFFTFFCMGLSSILGRAPPLTSVALCDTITNYASATLPLGVMTATSTIRTARLSLARGQMPVKDCGAASPISAGIKLRQRKRVVGESIAVCNCEVQFRLFVPCFFFY